MCSTFGSIKARGDNDKCGGELLRNREQNVMEGGQIVCIPHAGPVPCHVDRLACRIPNSYLSKPSTGLPFSKFGSSPEACEVAARQFTCKGSRPLDRCSIIFSSMYTDV